MAQPSRSGQPMVGSAPPSLVTLLGFVDIRKITGFLLRLFLLCPHTIQLRFIEHDLDCIVPAQIALLIEDRSNLFPQIFRDLDFVCFLIELILDFLELLPQLGLR
jgi:hypothetical protein